MILKTKIGLKVKILKPINIEISYDYIISNNMLICFNGMVCDKLEFLD